MDCSPPGSSMGFPRQEYQSGLPFPSSGGPPDPWIKPALPTLAGGFFTTKPPGNPLRTLFYWGLDFCFFLNSVFCMSALKSMWNMCVFSSVIQSGLTLCEPMDCSTPGFPVHHQLLELAQTHVPQFGDAIQPSHPLLTPSPPAFNLAQLQGLFQGVSSSHQVASIGISASASVLPMNIQD